MDFKPSDSQLTEMISEARLQARIKEMAREISADFKGEKLLVIAVLKGAFLFVADLVREMDIDPEIDFLRATSYGSQTVTSGAVEIRKDVEVPVTGRAVLLVEDIIDTGLTLKFLLRHLKAAEPKVLKICSLLDKPSRRQVEVKGDYVGFTIEDKFVVGYGLDFDERYRNLRSICVLAPG